MWHFFKRAQFHSDVMLRRPQTRCSLKSAHWPLSMLCYTLTLLNLHCPNKVYVKECQSNKCEIHQGDKCSGSWLGLAGYFFCPKGPGQPEIPLPLREQASWHKGNYSLHPLHHRGEKCPEETVLTFRGVSAVQISLKGGSYAGSSTTTGHISTLQARPHPEP